MCHVMATSKAGLGLLLGRLLPLLPLLLLLSASSAPC
jgi:hypothetical protein